MKKLTTILLCCGIVAALIGIVALVEPTRILLGVLKRDSFFEGRPTSFWRQRLRDGDDAALNSPVAVPVLAEALRDSNPGVRQRAAAILGELGPEAAASVPALLEALKDEDGAIDPDVIRALRQVEELRKQRPDEVEITIKAGSVEEAARYAAAESLKKIDPAAAKQAGLP